MPIIENKAKELNIDLYLESPVDEKPILGTIVFSRQMNALSHRLPKPNYVQSRQQNLGVDSFGRSRTSDGPRKKRMPDVLEPVKEERIPSERSAKSRLIRLDKR